ncbi:MAG: hypothetical protein ACXV2A_05610 [Halobacteriota archaeon]
MKATQLDTLREACQMTKRARVERLRTKLDQITTELDKRDFSDVPTAKLVELELKTRAELAREFADHSIRSEGELRKAKSIRRPQNDMLWLNEGDTSPLLDADDSGNEQKQPRRAKKPPIRGERLS